MILKRVAVAFGLLTFTSISAAQGSSSALPLPLNIVGMVKESEVSVSDMAQSSPQVKALVNNAQEARIDCQRVATFGYMNPQAATQGLSSWLATQQMQAVAADEMSGGSYSLEDGPSNQVAYWKAEKGEGRYAGAWLGNAQGGKMFICSGIPIQPSSLYNTNTAVDNNHSTTHRRIPFFLIIAIIGFIIRRVSKGLSSSDLD